jgi:hypothetical protein
LLWLPVISTALVAVVLLAVLVLRPVPTAEEPGDRHPELCTQKH